LLPKLCNLLKEEDSVLEGLQLQLKDPKLKKVDRVKISEDIEKCRIRTQAYLRRMFCRHNIIEDFGEVMSEWNTSRFLVLERDTRAYTKSGKNISLQPPSCLLCKENLLKENWRQEDSSMSSGKDVRMLQRWMERKPERERKRDGQSLNLRPVRSIAEEVH
jgi:RNA polymerase primary sigma factor